MKIPKFVWSYITINTSQNFQADASDVVFLNTGITNVTINGLTLSPGDSTTDSAFGMEYSNTNYSIIFATGSGNLVIKRKKYIGFIDFTQN